MDWNAGYIADLEYTAGFYREQSPAYLNFVCVLNGYEPIALDRPYTYFELGFGRGLTVNVQAAANPAGQFYATDFNPAHVSGARQMADQAGLTNLTLLENSFSDLAEGRVADLPQFDFITLHGIYSWISAENRLHIRTFIARYLKPGGVVYLSYNAMPGWTTAFPMQKLLLEHAKMHPNRSDAQMELARKFVAQLMELKGGYFELNPNISTRWQTLQSGNTNYLVHEYLNDHWQPLYHADVARELSDAKLDFIGSADLPFAFPLLYLSQQKHDMLNAIPDLAMRETVKDYMLNTSFRRDVFVRGARSMRHGRYVECLEQFGLALLVPRHKVSLKMKLAIGEVNGKEELYLPILDALAKRPHTVSELIALPALKGAGLANVMQVVTILAASSQASIYIINSSTAAGVSSLALNRALAKRIRYGEDLQVLVSPLLGNGVPASTMELLIYHLWSSGESLSDVRILAEKAWAIMAAQGRRMLKAGAPIEGDQDNIAEMTAMAGQILNEKLPIWRQLGIL
jgi:predicted O-methyltransferase YrrM